MKITHISPAHFPAKGYGGGPLVVHELCKQLKKKGNDINIITTNAFDKNIFVKNSSFSIANYSVFYLKNLHNLFTYRLKLFLPYTRSDFSVLRGIISKSDIVHVHDVRTFLGLFSINLAKRENIPVVIHPHGTLSYRVFLSNPNKAIFDFFFLKNILGSAFKILALNKSEQTRINQLYGKYFHSEDVVTILPNGVNMKNNIKMHNFGSFRRKMEIEKTSPLLLYLGRLHQSKNLIFLLNSFNEILGKKSDSILVFVGTDDGMKSRLLKTVKKYKIEESVKFSDYLEGKEKLSAFIDSDIHVIPSFYGFPLTILEAFSCGLPVITTNYGDVVPKLHNFCGIVTKYDSHEFASNIIDLIENKQKREQYSRNAIEFASYHKWDKIIGILLKIYEEILQ